VAHIVVLATAEDGEAFGLSFASVQEANALATVVEVTPRSWLADLVSLSLGGAHCM
jgi:hypothetical protein